MNRITKLAALAGMIGPFLFGSVLLVLTVVEYDFMRSRIAKLLTDATCKNRLVRGDRGSLDLFGLRFRQRNS